MFILQNLSLVIPVHCILFWSHQISQQTTKSKQDKELRWRRNKWEEDLLKTHTHTHTHTQTSHAHTYACMHTHTHTHTHTHKVCSKLVDVSEVLQTQVMWPSSEDAGLWDPKRSGFELQLSRDSDLPHLIPSPLVVGSLSSPSAGIYSQGSVCNSCANLTSVGGKWPWQNSVKSPSLGSIRQYSWVSLGKVHKSTVRGGGGAE